MNAKKLSIALFFSLLVVLPIVTLILPKQERSEIENRTLQEPPKMSGESLMDKSYMKDVEDYLSDHMVWREYFVAAKTRFELAQGRNEVNNVFISNKMLIENVSAPNQAEMDLTAEAINQFAEKYKDKMDVNMMLIPTASEFYPNNVPDFAAVQDQTEFIHSFYQKLKNVNSIDAFAPLSASTEEYIFYKTDHHWTSYGAYLGYSALSKTLGFKPATSDMFNIEHASYDFLGTLYSKVLYGENLKDRIDIYEYANGNPVADVIKYTDKNTQTYSSILFREYLDQKDKYSVFLGENESIVRVKTNVKNGKKLILFKDSFSHALMQFLPLHYEEILLVDLRYLNVPLSEYVDVNDYTQALFVYNMAGFVKDYTIKKVRSFA